MSGFKSSGVNILDAFMGTGKSTAIQKYFDENRDKKFVFVYPYTIKSGTFLHSQYTEKLGFSIADEDAKGKMDFFLRQLEAGKSVVITHALNQHQTPESKKLMIDGGYHLVIDEVPEVFQTVFPEFISNKNIFPQNLNRLHRLFGPNDTIGETRRQLIGHAGFDPKFNMIFNQDYHLFESQFQ